MNRHLIYRLFGSALVFGLSWLGAVRPVGAQPSGADAALRFDVPPAISIVTLTNTAAVIRRSGWTGYSRLDLGSSVQFGDLVDPKSSPVRVLCPDLNEKVIADLGPIPCRKDRSILMQGTQILASWQRGKPVDLSLPFLIAPRATKIASANPVIRWNPVLNADSYEIIVRGDGLNWTITTPDATKTMLTYPKSAPLLTPGNKYTVEIVALKNGASISSSADEDAPDLSFTLLDPDAVAKLQKSVKAIKNSVPNKPLTDLTLAQFDAQNGLTSDAFSLLLGISGDLLADDSTLTITQAVKTPPADSLTASPALYLALGDVALSGRLDLYAVAAYAKARDLAHGLNDTAGEAQALTGLARVTLDPDKRSHYVTQAVALWMQLGAQAQIDQLGTEFAAK